MTRTTVFFEKLEQRGWQWRDGSLYAPNASMWFVRAAEPYWEEQLADLSELRARMERRRDRIAEDSTPDPDSARALADVEQVVQALLELERLATDT